MDLTTNKRSTRFSEEIGLELFQLDADSFERSTYLPQWQDFEGLSTDNIQAKLGNLVEDRGDVGNFDRAVAALKTARSGFIPYRGNGGSVAEAQGQVSRIQGELERTQAQEQSLNREEADISALEIQLEVCKSRKEQLHQKMDAATAAAAVAAAHREYDRLNEEKQQLEADLQQLSSRYPRAIPEDAQIGEARQAAAELAVLAVQQVQTREDQEAAAWLEENGHRFQGHVPTAEELGDCRSRISGYLALERELENTELSEADQAQYEKLLPLWSAGAMEENRLEALDAACRERTKKQHALETIALSDQEKEQMTRLGAYFDSGVPEEAALQQHREKLEQARLLRRENRQKLEELANAPEQGKATGMILCWVLALAGIGTGIWLLAGKLMWGYGALAVGGISLIGALISLVRKVRQDREIRAWEQALREAVAANEARIAALEQAVEAFAARCTALRPLTEALHEIKNNREDLLALGEKAAQLRKAREALAGETARLEEALRQALGQGDFDKNLLKLRLAAVQFRGLQQEKAATEEKRIAREAEIAQIREAISAFLGAYFQTAEPENFHSLLSELQRSSEAYLRATQQVEDRKQREADHARRLGEQEARLDAIFAAWGLERQERLQEQLLRIRDDSRDHRELLDALAQSGRKQAAFAAQHREELQIPVPEVQEDIPALRLEEYRLAGEMEELSGQLLAARQRRSQILNRLSRIPTLRDELESWQEMCSADRKKAEILDKTVSFLTDARQSLQNSYFGPVRENFRGYMQELLEEGGQGVFLAPDLEVRLERSGESRELGYFSAGQTDAVMLCMRLALVDALFPEVRPFVILDDPFVNLDDERTAKAWKLLQKLAREKQIIYLTCNSSRSA